MSAFEILLYAVAILGVLLLRAEAPQPAPAPAPIPDVQLPPLEDLVSEAEALAARPVSAMAAPLAAPTAIAVVEVEASYRAMSSAQLRKECRDADIRYAHARGKGKHLTKGQMIAALEALE